MITKFVLFRIKLYVVLGAVAVFALSAWSDDDGLDTGKLIITGFGSHETGEILKGRHMNVDFAHQWLMREFVNISANYTANEHFRLAVGMTGRIWYETYPDAKRNPWFPRKQYITVYPHVASGVFSYDVGNIGQLEMEFGYFPFKYNPDVRNLGAYLFRCNTYPPSVITNFDLTYSRLSGGRVGVTIKDMFNLQLLLTQENELPSFYDPSLSLLADVKVKKMFDIGAGIQFNRFIAADSLATWAMSRLGTPSTYFDTVDSVTKTLTHAGIKMMSRFSFDPKRLFIPEGNGFFGENDLRLYGEIALLGLKDYPIYYQDWKKRIPRMIGFNWPTHEFLSYGIIPGVLGYSLRANHDGMNKALGTGLITETSGLAFGTLSWLARKYLDWNMRPDLCAVELEYYGWNHSNGYLWVVMDGTAVPNTPNGDYADEKVYNNDNWKWTVYLKKTFYRHSYVLLQFANDHWSLPQWDEKNYDRDEFCGRNTHWYWITKFGVTF
jgi:hypothetical protein